MHGAYIYDIFSRLEKFEKNFTVQNRQICMDGKDLLKKFKFETHFFRIYMHACMQASMK